MRVFLVIFILCFGLLGFSQNPTLFEQGNTLYNEGKYEEAIEKYEAVLNTKQHSAELYFNLGNSHYKLNNVAPCIYYYEKALQLKPNDKEIKNNMSFARNMTIDAIDKVPEVGFSRIFKNVINKASSDTWAKIAIAGVLVFVFLFLLYRFAQVTTQKRIAFIVSVFSLFVAGFSLLMAFQKDNIESKNNPAIVFAQESKVKADPNNASEELFRLHEGTKIQILEAYKDWYKIEIADKTSGWIPQDDIKALDALSF